jgi:hypothetical protein
MQNLSALLGAGAEVNRELALLKELMDEYFPAAYALADAALNRNADDGPIFTDLFDAARVRWNHPCAGRSRFHMDLFPSAYRFRFGQPNPIGEYPLDIGTAKRKSNLHCDRT